MPSAKMSFAKSSWSLRAFPKQTSLPTSLDTSGRRWLFRRHAFEPHRFALAIAIHQNVIARQNLAFEDLQRQRILNHALNSAPQRPRAVSRVVAFAQENFLCRSSKFQRDVAFGEKRFDALEKQADNAFQLFLAKRIKDHDLIDPVDEFRTKRRTQRFHRSVPGTLRVAAR